LRTAAAQDAGEVASNGTRTPPPLAGTADGSGEISNLKSQMIFLAAKKFQI
jgi:hypothetical protein